MDSQRKFDFDGKTYEREFDCDRLNRQMRAIYEIMIDGQWRTIEQISKITHFNHASISARLRDFRKTRFGAFEVERRRKGDPKGGLFEYRLLKRTHA